jgi:hypothetical protein
VNNRYLYFILIQLSVITILPTASALSGETGMKSLKGNIVCIEVDNNGTVEPKENFTECNGLLVFVGMDRKIYALTGAENDLNELIDEPKSRMGYLPPLNIRGDVEGNQRAWILHVNGMKSEKSEKINEQTVTGTIVCLIPDYYKGNVKPFVSVVPCNEYEPHMHIIYNSAGQIYVIHGTEDRVSELEKYPNRKSVTLNGAIEGNKKGWILALD